MSTRDIIKKSKAHNKRWHEEHQMRGSNESGEKETTLRSEIANLENALNSAGSIIKSPVNEICMLVKPATGAAAPEEVAENAPQEEKDAYEAASERYSEKENALIHSCLNVFDIDHDSINLEGRETSTFLIPNLNLFNTNKDSFAKANITLKDIHDHCQTIQDAANTFTQCGDISNEAPEDVCKQVQYITCSSTDDCIKLFGCIDANDASDCEDFTINQ